MHELETGAVGWAAVLLQGDGCGQNGRMGDIDTPIRASVLRGTAIMYHYLYLGLPPSLAGRVALDDAQGQTTKSDIAGLCWKPRGEYAPLGRRALVSGGRANSA